MKQREIHDILSNALAAGEAALRPGVLACEVDAAVRGVVERAGYGANFPHHSGHAYGIFQQERPYLIPAETMPLEEGMVLAVEPGIYIPDWGGMRLEGGYVITGTGGASPGPLSVGTDRVLIVPRFRLKRWWGRWRTGTQTAHRGREGGPVDPPGSRSVKRET